MAFAIKAEVCDPQAQRFAFTAQKTMYGGKYIAEGDTVFVFASENEGGQGLIARGVVSSAKAMAEKRGIATGETVTVSHNGTSVELRARVSRGLREGVVRIASQHAGDLGGAVEVRK